MSTSFIKCSAIFFLCACIAFGAKKRHKEYDCNKQVDKAIQKYEKKRYDDVKTILDEVRMQCGGSSIIDTVRYYLGMGNLRSKNYLDAQIEFEQVTQNFPNSNYAEESQFRIGQCSFLDSPDFDRDQAKTNDAIRQLGEFIETHAASPFADSAKTYLNRAYDKLAHKDFASAKFYEKVREYDAAVVYFQIVLADHATSAYVPEAKLGLAHSLAKVNRMSECIALLDEIDKSSYAPEIKNKAQLLRSRLSGKQ
jgi:outer membrane protein assembly factor BamD